MNYSTLNGNAQKARDYIIGALKSCLTKEGHYYGAGQFIQQNGQSEHVGVYGTAAILETMSECDPSIVTEHLDDFLKVVSRLVTDNGQLQYLQDRKLTFKLCAAISALKSVPSESRNDDVLSLQETLVKSLFSLVRTDESTKMAFWPYAESETSPEDRAYVLPTAYAVSALAGVNSSPDLIRGAVEFLVYHLKRHLRAEDTLEPHELVHVLLALDTVVSERRKLLNDAQIHKMAFFLYRHLARTPGFDGTFINFMTNEPAFASLFYVAKTNLTILKYFLQTDSRYLKSSDVYYRAEELVEIVIKHTRFVNDPNNKAAVRENALALRVINLLVSRGSLFKTNVWVTFFYNHLRWTPRVDKILNAKRLLVFVCLPSIPLAHAHWFGGGWDSIVSITLSIIAALIYDTLRRSR